MDKITDFERVQLINQFRILSLLDKDNEKTYNENIQILLNGYEIFYDQIEYWLCDKLEKSEAKFVLDVLDIFRSLDDYIVKNPNININVNYKFFPGFDGNYESKYLNFARFLIEVQGKFMEQTKYFKSNDNMNSHTQMLDIYRAMIREWNNLGGNFMTDIQQITQVINAR